MRTPLTGVMLIMAIALNLPVTARAQISVPPGTFDPEREFSIPFGDIDIHYRLFPHCSERLCGEQRWNFERTTEITSSTMGDLQGWTGTLDGRPLRIAGLAAGSSVLVSRVLTAFPGTVIPSGHEQQRSMRSLLDIGGDYWDGPYHTGYEGTFWLGSFENRPTLDRPLGSARGNAVTMDVTSPEFSIDTRGPRYIHFLAGGGCSPHVKVVLEQRVYRAPAVIGCVDEEALLTTREQAVRYACRSRIFTNDCFNAHLARDEAREKHEACRAQPGATGLRAIPSPSWEPAAVVVSRPPSGSFAGGTVVTTPFKHFRTAPNCNEAMSRVTWNLSRLMTRPEDVGYRLRVIDASTTAHINVDDFWVTNNATVPEPRVPVWGVADLHAHLMNEKGTMAFSDGSGPALAARGLWGSVHGPIESLNRCNDTHTTNDYNFNSHQDEVLGTTYTFCRDICLDKLDGAGRGASHHSTHGGSDASWADWPIWSSAIHQQMHTTWIHRAYKGGLRLMIATVGNAESIGFGLLGERNHAFTSDQDALALQIPAIFDFAGRNSTWVEVALTPQDARRIIGSGRLALIIGVELDHIMDNCGSDVLTQRHHVASEWGSVAGWAAHYGFNMDVIEEDTLGIIGAVTSTFGNLVTAGRVMHVRDHPKTCTPAQIEARLDSLYRAGVRHVIPMHFADNMLGGYAITDALFTINSIFGNPDARAPSFMMLSEASALGIDLTQFDNDIGNLINVPGWLRISPDHILGMSDHLPPGTLRAVTDFVAARCISDDGWRVVAGIFTLGASEINCGASELTRLLADASHETIPWEGAVDTAVILGLGLPGPQHAGPEEALPSHINARGLQPDGRVFIWEMMRRGMMVDIQHASERAKNEIAAFVDGYPLMASHGGAQLTAGGQRKNENTLSRTQFMNIYQRSSPGIVGLGMQSAEAFRGQLRDIKRVLGARDYGVGLGSDMNGFDWHAFPRFGPDGFFPENPAERRARATAGLVGSLVKYSAYDAATNARSTMPGPDCEDCSWPMVRASAPPELNPHRISKNGRVVRTFDINYDGYAHYGMTPDFLQEVLAVGGTRDELAAVLRSAESTLRMWEQTCVMAYRMTTAPPTSIVLGCGPSGAFP